MNIRKDVSVALWESEKGLAEVTVRKGKLWCSMGVIRSSKLYCNVEEAVYLVGLGSLVLLRNDRLLSIDEIYSLLFIPAHGCSWAAYQAFAYLKRLGYIVGRHDVLWTTSRKQEKLNTVKSTVELDQASKDEELMLSSSMESVVESNSREIQTPSSDILDELRCDSNPTRTGSSLMGNREEEYGNEAAVSPCNTGRSNYPWVDATADLDVLQPLSRLSMSKDEDWCGSILMFDVFLPNGRFKKSTPGLPAFRLCISSGQPPKPDELRALEHKVCGIPLKFVVVECGHISIFSFDTLSLPDLP